MLPKVETIMKPISKANKNSSPAIIFIKHENYNVGHFVCYNLVSDQSGIRDPRTIDNSIVSRSWYLTRKPLTCMFTDTSDTIFYYISLVTRVSSPNVFLHYILFLNKSSSRKVRRPDCVWQMSIIIWQTRSARERVDMLLSFVLLNSPPKGIMRDE